MAMTHAEALSASAPTLWAAQDFGLSHREQCGALCKVIRANPPPDRFVDELAEALARRIEEGRE